MNRGSLACSVAFVALVGCAGRAPTPVVVSQATDPLLECEMIQSEIGVNSQKIVQLEGEKGGKLAQNIAAGVGGLLIWPLWFAMDLQGTQGKEITALQNRNTTLAAMAATRCERDVVPAGGRRTASNMPSRPETVPLAMIPSAEDASLPEILVEEPTEN